MFLIHYIYEEEGKKEWKSFKEQISDFYKP